MAAALNGRGASAGVSKTGLVRRVRDRLHRDPRAGHVTIAVLAAAALLALPLSASNVLDSIGRVRATLSTFATISVAADEAELALERALLDERIAAVAADAADLHAARARFEAEAVAVRAAMSRVRHPERLPPGLRTDVMALRQALGTALDELRRRLPDAPRGTRPDAPRGTMPDAPRGTMPDAPRGTMPDAPRGARNVSSPDVGVVDAPDEAGLTRTRTLAAVITEEAGRVRLEDLGKIERRERAATVSGAAIVASVLLLLAGAASRLIAGRQRLNAARGRERLQSERLERAVNGMREGVALFAADGTLILRNQRFAETAGLTPAATAIGTPFATIAAALADGVPPVLGEALGHERRELSGEMRVGARMLEVFRAAMPGGGEILTLADVTKRVEGEVVARRAVKLEALGRLTSGVAHDFNNLLQGLSANLETFAALGPEAPAAERRERFEASLDLVERGTRLTRQLLSFTRSRTAAATPIDAAALLRNLEDLLERTIGDRVELQLVLDPGLWPVLVDRSGFENAILNLAINARDAMPDGGTISIVGTNLPPAAAGDAPSVLVCVADSGIGMDAEQRRRATEPFFTTKPEGVGTGLGLAMVSGFATDAGGAFTLESEIGRGTRAMLRLPRAIASPDAEDAIAARGHPVRGLGETILLVEDDHAVRRAVCSGLEAIGYRVVEAASIDGACRLLGGDVSPDLVLSDVMLPGSLGPLDLLRTARELLPLVPVLFNTGDPEAHGARTLPLDERTVLLVKPWRLDELARLIRKLLEGALPLDPARREGPPGPAYTKGVWG